MNTPATSPLRRLAGLLVPAAVVGLFLFQIWQVELSSGRRIGIVISEAATGGFTIVSLQPGQPAERDGLAVGDRVLAVDGHEVRKLLDYHAVAARFTRAEPVVYRVLRGTEEVQVTVRPGIPLPWLQSALTALTLLAYLAIAWLMREQAGGDLRARLLQLFTIAVALELAAPSSEQLIGNSPLMLAAGLFYLGITGIQIGLELHLVSLIPERQAWVSRWPWMVPLFYAAGLTATLLVAVGFLSDGLGLGLVPWSARGAYRTLFHFGFPAWALGVAWLLGRQATRHPEPRGRQQAGLVLIGLLPWVASVLIGSAHDLLGITRWAWLDQWPLILLPFPVAVFVAIYRYQLFDIELVVRRGLLYTALTTSLLLVFYAALGAGGALFSHAVGSQHASVWVIAGATLLLGLLFAPLRQALQRLIDRRFFPERSAVRQRLVALARELPALGKLPLMGRHLVGQLTGIFGIDSASLLIATPQGQQLVTLASTLVDFEEQFDQSFLLSPDDPGIQLLCRAARPLPARQPAAHSASMAQRLHRLDAELTAPLLAQQRLVGLLLLGEKRDQRPFTSEELELLNLLSHHVATVFENARLFESATFEGLTGILRREAILEELDRELNRALRYHRPLALALADLDHFKAVNDRHGHLAGDLLLKRAAQALAAPLRATDAVGRFGGEEFLVVLPETDLAGAVAVAEKLRQTVADLAVELDDGTLLKVTVSIGLAAVDAEAEWSPTALELLAEADRALYRAKGAGRNRVEATGG